MSDRESLRLQGHIHYPVSHGTTVGNRIWRGLLGVTRRKMKTVTATAPGKIEELQPAS